MANKNNNVQTGFGFSTILGSSAKQFQKELDDKLTSTFFGRKVSKKATVNNIFTKETTLPKKSKELLEYEINKLSEFLQTLEIEEHEEVSDENKQVLQLIKKKLTTQTIDENNPSESKAQLEKVIEILNNHQIIFKGLSDVNTSLSYILVDNIELLKKQLYPDLDYNVQEGVCFGLVSSFINAIFSNNLTTFAQRLKILSQPPKQGWLFFGQHYDNLEDAIHDAYTQYQKFIQAQKKTHLTHEQLYNQFEQECPDGFQLMELRAWLDLLFVSQASEELRSSNDFIPSQQDIDNFQHFNFIGSNALLKAVQKKEGKQPIFITKHWPVPLLKEHLATIFNNLPNGTYTISTPKHILAFKKEANQVLLFDQNLPEFFLSLNEYTSDVFIGEVFKVVTLNNDINVAICEIAAVDADQANISSINKALKELTFAVRDSVYEHTKLSHDHIKESELYFAISDNNIEALKHLLTKKENIELLKKEHGRSTIIAAYYGHADIVPELLSAGDKHYYVDSETKTKYIITDIGEEFIKMEIDDVIISIPIVDSKG